MANLPAPEKTRSRDEAANTVNVNPRSVETASKVINECIPEIIEAVMSGQIATRIKPMFEQAAKERQIRKPESVKANLPEQKGQSRDEAANTVNVSPRSVESAAWDGYYWSRLNILVGMWLKGRVISEYRGINSENWLQLEKTTGRSDKSLKKWHCI